VGNRTGVALHEPGPASAAAVSCLEDRENVYAMHRIRSIDFTLRAQLRARSCGNVSVMGLGAACWVLSAECLVVC
jgi:hypothetical protein